VGDIEDKRRAVAGRWGRRRLDLAARRGTGDDVGEGEGENARLRRWWKGTEAGMPKSVEDDGVGVIDERDRIGDEGKSPHSTFWNDMT
jgi:hypothetical protein